jgi:hypothetical protein
MNKYKVSFINFAVSLVLLACNSPDIDRKSKIYFITNDFHEWQYKRWVSNDPSNPLEMVLDTMKLRLDGETEIDNLKYFRIVGINDETAKVVRVQGYEYYARNHELYLGLSEEYKFLDVSKLPGEGWSYLKHEGLQKTEYVILEKNVSKTILDKTYHNVIVVKVNYYQRTENEAFELWLSAIHYYAPGIGEIYFYYPSPISGMYANLSGFILP